MEASSPRTALMASAPDGHARAHAAGQNNNGEGGESLAAPERPACVAKVELDRG